MVLYNYFFTMKTVQTDNSRSNYQDVKCPKLGQMDPIWVYVLPEGVRFQGWKERDYFSTALKQLKLKSGLHSSNPYILVQDLFDTKLINV